LRLLDSAERLFGEHGYNGVGMRALAERAQVNLAATTYHFGSKKALYVETFLRRFRASIRGGWSCSRRRRRLGMGSRCRWRTSWIA
jgi:AcrR family transcriptional regulator